MTKTQTFLIQFFWFDNLPRFQTESYTNEPTHSQLKITKCFLDMSSSKNNDNDLGTPPQLIHSHFHSHPILQAGPARF